MKNHNCDRFKPSLQSSRLPTFALQSWTLPKPWPTFHNFLHLTDQQAVIAYRLHLVPSQRAVPDTSYSSSTAPGSQAGR